MALIAAAIIGGVATIAGSAIGAIGAGRRAKRARKEKKNFMREMEELEASRQDVINPFEGVTDLSSMIQDLSGMAKDLSGNITDLSGNIDNPYANLSVATGAAEMQAEQTDIALANTLDALQATGASAGGATALAQAALKSKKDIAASIEQQEVSNEKLRAQGEQQMQAMQLAEQQRVQQAKLSEGQRVQGAKMTEALRVQEGLMREQGRLQQADVSGRQFVFSQTERREMEQLDRKQALITGARMAETQAQSDKAGSIAAGISGVGNIAGTYMANR